MADTVVVAESPANTGYRFSWGLAIAGGVSATAVTFLLLTLGSGFGLLLVHPMMSNSGPSAPAFLTGGAIYFMAAQACGFAAGGYVAGRFLGPLVETQMEEDMRAAAHGLVAWAVTVIATLVLVAIAGLTAASTATTTAALYGSMPGSKGATTPSAYVVDGLMRPDAASASTQVAPSATSPDGTLQPTVASSAGARAEAARIIDADVANGETLVPADSSRLIALVSEQAHVSTAEATQRVDQMQVSMQDKTKRAADLARKIASYTSLWIAASLLFGAIVAMLGAAAARDQDDKAAARAR